ncbi:triphosphoribosyl-dephospho-CoA synthase [uncultured Prevotella sp.]|uniref:triphosphoribosyl-dephospho-CoA synthase n=1 Tax=uncultured Prevotella sp. TaxID=159272 RepID=UPI00261999E4|nr:triphosphoribosyl-dephospho-CoA synthase [uncultured Prevotella sp.]
MELIQLNPSIPRQRRRIEQFLDDNGLRLDDVDYYAALVDDTTDEIVAGGGLKEGVIKCVAVADGHKGEAVANQIVSHLIAHANADGHQCVKLFTKPQNRQMFESMSFRLLAEAPKAILMETGIGGIRRYSEELRVKSEESNSELHYITSTTPQPVKLHHNNTSPQHPIMPQRGIIIMNCNPFTLGHRYLIEQAAQQVQTLYILVVREDCSMFSYDERKAMIERGVSHINNVVVCDGSEYSISATTFPTYFLKSLSDASDTQMTLDIDLYRRHIAPALGATVRFVGTEPDDPLTRRYNELMKSMLPDVREVARLQQGGVAVSASRVRKAIVENHLALAARLVPPTTVPYIVAHLATRALKAELNTTPKPGLVDSHDSGAHRDMDHALMMRSIRAMHPYFVKLATLGYDSPKLPAHDDIVSIGLEAEKAMFKSTGGVNTYKGALFSMGLALTAATYIIGRGKVATTTHGKEYVPGDLLSAIIIQLANGFPDTRGTHGSQAKQTAQAGGSLKSALDNAREGYTQLFEEWLPFYETRIKGDDSYVKHKTLLRIMCDLDDTNIVYRTDYDTMLNVKALARHLLEDFSEAGIEDMNRDFVGRNISPGGSADMLALVVFLFGITRKD